MNTSTHFIYVTSVIKGLEELCEKDTNAIYRILELSEVILLLAMLNLEPIRPMLERCYCPIPYGHPRYDAVATFRSLILLACLGKYSLRKWPTSMKSLPELRIIAGFPDIVVVPEKQNTTTPNFPDVVVVPDEQDTTTPTDGNPQTPTTEIHLPQKSAYYDFCKRLLNGPYQEECDHYSRPSRTLDGTHGSYLRNLAQEKELAKEELKAAKLEPDERRVQQAVREALAREASQFPYGFVELMNELLWYCAVIPSFRSVLKDSLDKLAVSADSSVVRTQASSIGKRQCNCRNEGKDICECPRAYADPDATWGYDSYQQQFFFGHRIHTIDTKANTRDLPLYIRVTDAHTPDPVVAVENLAHATHLTQLATAALTTSSPPSYTLTEPASTPEQLAQMITQVLQSSPQTSGCSSECSCHSPAPQHPSGPSFPLPSHIPTPVKIAIGIFDKAYDATAFYEYLRHIDIIPIIPLRTKPKLDANGIQFNELGIPLCPAGLPMRHHGVNNKRKHSKFGCPAKYLGRENGKPVFKVRPGVCPLDVLCEPDSKMGPLLYLPLEQDFRLHVPIPRDSDRFKELYKQRTSSERLYSQGQGRGFFDAPYRRRYLYQITATAYAIACHARAWVRERWGNSPISDVSVLFFRLRQLLHELAPP